MAKIDVREVSNNYLDHLYMKMILKSDDIKSKIKMFNDELKNSKDILSKLYIYISLNELTNNDVKNAYILLETIYDLSDEKNKYRETINHIKVMLNSSKKVKDESYYLAQYIIHSSDKNDLSKNDIYDIIHNDETKETMNYQIEFDYYFFSLLLKCIFDENYQILYLLNDEDMFKTDIVVNTVNLLINEIPIIFKSSKMKNTLEQILNVYIKLISYSNLNIFDKRYLKKQTKKCITKLN